MTRLLIAPWLVLIPGAALGATVSILISIGSNLGDSTDAPLSFAEADAQRVHALFTELGGVSSDRAYLVLNSPASKLREKLAEVAGRIAELSRAGNDVVLLVYASGHARAGELHLRGTHFPLGELRDFASNTKARVRVVLVDACESGVITRQKGATAGPEYEVALETMPLRGQVMISSSGPAEPSQEWGSLQGSLFTHHLLTGLRGDADADGDGQVTLSEAYAYAYRRTVAEETARVQHPAVDLDLAGAGELVLTRPARARTALLFPASLEGDYLVLSQPRPDLVIEVAKRKGKVARVALPPGSYLVRKRMGDTVGLIGVELPYGGEHLVDESRMVRRPFGEVALKGEPVELEPNAVVAFGDVGTNAVLGAGPSWHVGFGYRRNWVGFWGQASIGFGWTHFRGVDLTISQATLSVQVSGGYRWLLSPCTVHAGFFAELEGYRQSYERDQEQVLESTYGQGHLPTRYFWGVGLGPTAGVEVPIAWGAFAWAQAQVGVRELPVINQVEWRPTFQGFIGVGKTF